jgi:hypothetical protein
MSPPHKRTGPADSGTGSKTRAGAGVGIILRHPRRVYTHVLLRVEPFDAAGLLAVVLLWPVWR